MHFYPPKRAFRYTLCGPASSITLSREPSRIRYGANFASQLPQVMFSNINEDVRRNFDVDEMRYFIRLVDEFSAAEPPSPK